MDHDHWEALRYEVLLYPEGADAELAEEQLVEGKDEALCIMCHKVPPAAGSLALCSRCAALFAAFEAQRARGGGDGAKDSEDPADSSDSD